MSLVSGAAAQAAGRRHHIREMESLSIMENHYHY